MVYGGFINGRLQYRGVYCLNIIIHCFIGQFFRNLPEIFKEEVYLQDSSLRYNNHVKPNLPTPDSRLENFPGKILCKKLVSTIYACYFY